MFRRHVPIPFALTLLLIILPPLWAKGESRPYLQFCGANGTIFGSTTLLHTGTSTILLDCGLFQSEGYPEREVERRNRSFPFSAREIDYVIASHAHGDHIGRIPLLFRHGFNGKIYCTEASAELARIMLPLLEWIMSKERPLYNINQVNRALANLVPLKYHQPYILPDGLRLEFQEAGHILGSAMARLEFKSGDREYSLLYSGDIGNPANPILRPLDPIGEVDILITESTYGDRRHNDPEDDRRAFREIVRETIGNDGKVIIPTYVLDRTQNVLYTLNRMIREGAFDRTFPIYVDSPFANRLTEVYRKHTHLFHEDVRAEIREREAPLSFPALKTFPPRGKFPGPAVIIAPGGMADQGAIRHHLVNYLPDPDSSVVFVGFQARGSLGREILDRKSIVRIDRRTVPVRAATHYLSSFSGHADYRQIGDWVKQADRIGHIFIFHGQPEASAGLKRHLEAVTPFSASVPAFLQKVYLDDVLPPLEKPVEEEEEKTPPKEAVLETAAR